MRCRLCHYADLPMAIAWPRFPIYIWPIKRDSDQEYHALNVYRCPRCGLVQLDMFEEDFVRKLYSREVFGLTSTTEFPTTLKKNSRFLKYCSKTLGERWCEDKDVLDVGGYDVLNAFDLGYRRGVICDPNAPDGHLRGNLSICKNFFARNWFKEGEFDALIAKHILEHINDLNAFMGDVIYVLKKRGILILETPELSGSLREGRYAVFYHQHLMYFDMFSLENVVRKFGLTIIDKTIDNGNLRMVAQKDGEKCPAGISYQKDPTTSGQLEHYGVMLERYLNRLESSLEETCRQGKCICYGAGGGTTILFHLSPRLKEFVEYVVDSSAQKIGKKIGGTPFVVEAPAILANIFNRDIFINSREFFDEISQELYARFEDHNFCHLKISPTFERYKNSQTIRK